MYKLCRNIRIVSYDLAGEQPFPGRSLGTSPVRGTGFRLVVPKCARFQRLRRAAGCFGEIAATPNPGRGLRFLVGWAKNCDWPQPHPKAAVFGPRPTACKGTAKHQSEPASRPPQRAAKQPLRPTAVGHVPEGMPAGDGGGSPAGPFPWQTPAKARKPSPQRAAPAAPHGQPPKAALRPCLP